MPKNGKSTWDISKLSFVRVEAGPDGSAAVDLWAPERTGNYAADCRTGREAANELLAMIKRHGCYALAGWVQKSQIKSGIFGALEIGFSQALAEAAVRGYIAPAVEPKRAPKKASSRKLPVAGKSSGQQLNMVLH